MSDATAPPVPARTLAMTATWRTGDANADRDARDMRWSRLMAAAQAGDARAYEALLRECLPLLRSICRTRLRDAAEVEETLGLPVLGAIPAGRQG